MSHFKVFVADGSRGGSLYLSLTIEHDDKVPAQEAAYAYMRSGVDDGSLPSWADTVEQKDNCNIVDASDAVAIFADTLEAALAFVAKEFGDAHQNQIKG